MRAVEAEETEETVDLAEDGAAAVTTEETDGVALLLSCVTLLAELEVTEELALAAAGAAAAAGLLSLDGDSAVVEEAAGGLWVAAAKTEVAVGLSEGLAAGALLCISPAAATGLCSSLTTADSLLAGSSRPSANGLLSCR